MAQIDGLTPTEIIEVATPFGAGVYGFLVLILLVAVMLLVRYLLKDKEHQATAIGIINKAHKEEVEVLRKENKELVETMLTINKENIPILTNVITALNNHEGINKTLIEGVNQLQFDHKRQEAALQELQKNAK